MKVLVTRPVNFAKTLCAKMQSLGMEAVLLPMIELQPASDQMALTEAIETLSDRDMAIFVSRAAVEFSLPKIRSRWKIFPNLLWAGVGPGTAQALHHHGVSDIICPKTPPHGSQALLNILPITSLYQKKIVIFRGNGGSTLLHEVLTQNSLMVHTVEAYQRCIPTPFQPLPIADQKNKSGFATKTEPLSHKLSETNQLAQTLSEIEVIVATSSECLNNFHQLLDSKTAWLKNIPIVIVSPSMQALANKLDFKYPVLAASAEDASIIKVLIHLQAIKGVKV